MEADRRLAGHAFRDMREMGQGASPARRFRPFPDRVEHSTRNGSDCHHEISRTEPLPNMELAALIVSTVALLFSVMALPTVFQMFWGGPQLRFGFTEIDGADGRRLYCDISSTPVENWALRRLGVRRETAIITAQFRICEAGSNFVMQDTAQTRLFDIAGSSDEGSFRATVTDHFGVNFPCAFHGHNSEQALTIDPLKKSSTALPPGRYRVDMSVACGDRSFSQSREMTVAKRSIFTCWS